MCDSILLYFITVMCQKFYLVIGRFAVFKFWLKFLMRFIFFNLCLYSSVNDLKIILKMKKFRWVYIIQMVSNDDYFPSILRVKNLSNLKVTLWVLDCLLVFATKQFWNWTIQISALHVKQSQRKLLWETFCRFSEHNCQKRM